VSELAYDARRGIRRTKTRPPDLPAKGNLDAFILGVAAAGDACCMNGGKRNPPASMVDEAKARSAEELEDLHVIYVQNRLMPYFRDVSKILAELPSDVLLRSAAFRGFVTSRKAIKGSTGKKKVFGPRALLLDPEEAAAAACALRRRYPDLSMLTRPSTTPATTTTRVTKDLKSASIVKAASAPSLPASPSSRSLPSPRSPPAKSGSGAPSLASRDGDYSTGNGRDHAARERRLATSHYGFFARSMPQQAFLEFGHASQRDFWKRMAAKEQRELGRRTLLRLKKNGVPPSALGARHGGRLPALPPSVDISRPQTSETQMSTTNDRSRHRLSSPSILEMCGKTQDNGPNRDKRAEIREDIREGLHVIILSEAASEEPHTKRMAALVADEKPVGRHMPTVEESLRVYKKYQELLETDGDIENESASEFNDHEDGNEDDDWVKQQHARVTQALENGFCKELLPVSWTTILNWVHHEHDLASHFRYKSACSALIRALQRWKNWESAPSQRFYGVSLNMLLQWTFPGLTYSDLAQILTWIAQHELEKIRQKTPRVLDAHDRRQLEGIFRTMDPKRRGYCTAEDISGGNLQDVSQRLKNIVDAETVRNVCLSMMDENEKIFGESSNDSKPHKWNEKISEETFLELFCEDNSRPREDSKSAVLEDGSKIVQVEYPAVGFSGWVYHIPPKEEEVQRSLINAIEKEVKRWKKQASSKKAKLQDTGVMM
jgi:hypothetical protein